MEETKLDTVTTYDYEAGPEEGRGESWVVAAVALCCPNCTTVPLTVTLIEMGGTTVAAISVS